MDIIHMHDNDGKKVSEIKTPVEESDYTFIQEKIKDRPVNKTRLFRKMVFTIAAAIIFGLVACLTFLLLEPVFSKMLTSDEEVNIEQITLQETVDEEYTPVDVEISEAVDEDGVITTFEETPIEDMTLEDSDTVESTSVNEASEVPSQVIVQEDYEISLDDYQLIYRKLYAMSELVSKSLVTLYCETGGNGDILNQSNTRKTSGLIIGDNGKELLIFADGRNLDNDASIYATFASGETKGATLKKMDRDTSLAVYAVKLRDISENTRENCQQFTLGTSVSSLVLGIPVMAVGDPLGTGRSICYGNITSMDTYISMEDASYQLLTTDIVGSSNGYGFLFNTKGQFIGIITPDNHGEGMEHMTYAYGVSLIRGIMEDMSNEKSMARLGIFLSDIPDITRKAQGVPVGVYVNKVTKDSPAMNVGLQPGDIICGFNDVEIQRITDYQKCLRQINPEDTVVLKINRYVGGEYKEVEIEITAEEK